MPAIKRKPILPEHEHMAPGSVPCPPILVFKDDTDTEAPEKSAVLIEHAFIGFFYPRVTVRIKDAPKGMPDKRESRRLLPVYATGSSRDAVIASMKKLWADEQQKDADNAAVIAARSERMKKR